MTLVWTKPDKLSTVQAEYTGNSDHKLIKVTRFSKSISRNARYVRKRSFKNFCAEDFCKEVKQLAWLDLFMCEDVHQATDLLTAKLTTILDVMAPVKTFQVQTKYAPWLSEETKVLIKKRKEAQITAAQSKSQDDWREFKNLRNTTTARIRKEKKIWEKNKLDHMKEDPSSIWKTVKGWLNWNNSGPPTQLFHQGRIVNSPAGLSGTRNQFFVDKVQQLQQRIPPVDTDPLAKLRQSMSSRQCVTLRPVHPIEILKIIKDLKNSKSTGTDNIETKIIKLVAEEIVPAVTHIVNLSIAQHEFPKS